MKYLRGERIRKEVIKRKEETIELENRKIIELIIKLKAGTLKLRTMKCIKPLAQLW